MNDLLRKVGDLPFDPQAALENITAAVRDCINVHEVESTKRELIRTERDVLLREIRAKETVFLEYLDRSFDERRRNFQALFESLSHAISAGDTTAMGTILGSITTLAANGPFKDLQDLDFVAEKLVDRNYVWEA